MSGPEVRIDQLTGLRTILAPARSERPIELAPRERPATGDAEAAPGREAEEAVPGSCPFCEGREASTPPEIWSDRPGGPPDSPGWRVRSVPNLYPALAAPEDGAPPADSEKEVAGLTSARDPLLASSRQGQPDLFSARPATGVHEVIVNSPNHATSLSQLDEMQLAAAVGGWRERMRARGAASAYVQLIVNEGPDAGASLDHSHAQLYALDFVPTAVARERERFIAYHQSTQGGDLLADIAAEEVRRRDRLVAIDDDAMILCPWASRGPFELRIVPRRPAARFEEDGEVGAGALTTALRALRTRLGFELQLNLWIRTAPRDAGEFEWHIDVLPRLSVKAGFELSTGIDINVYPPERAASELREVLG